MVFLLAHRRGSRGCSALIITPRTRCSRSTTRSAGSTSMALSMTGPARDVTVIGGGKSELDAVLARDAGESWPSCFARRRTAGRVLLPLGPLQPRQARGADVQHQIGAGPRRGRSRGGCGMERGLPRAPLPRARRRIRSGVGLAQCPGRAGSCYYLLGRDACDRATTGPTGCTGDEFRRIRDASCAAPGGC